MCIDVFDAAMVVVAMYTYNILHPAWLLADSEPEVHEESNMNEFGLRSTSGLILS